MDPAPSRCSSVTLDTPAPHSSRSANRAGEESSLPGEPVVHGEVLATSMRARTGPQVPASGSPAWAPHEKAPPSAPGATCYHCPLSPGDFLPSPGS